MYFYTYGDAGDLSGYRWCPVSVTIHANSIRNYPGKRISRTRVVHRLLGGKNEKIPITF